MISLGISRPEVRTDTTTSLVHALTAAATGGSVATWAAGAVECATGLWSRGLSLAEIPDDVPIRRSWLAEVGRDLARRGEVVYLLDASRGRLRFLRAYTSDVWGDGPDIEDWWYRLTVTGPRTTETMVVPSSRVLHVRYATERFTPARGLSPLQYASLTGTLTAALETALGEEVGGAVARLITMPEGHTDDPDNPLANVVRDAKGKTLLMETTAGGYGDMQGRPQRDWSPVRLGADPPSSLIALRSAVENTVLSCYGVPSSLGPGGVSDGTAMRESSRRFWALTIAPLLGLVAEELERVLERPVHLHHGQAAGTADVASRARAAKALNEAGVPIEDAMRRVGWDD